MGDDASCGGHRPTEQSRPKSGSSKLNFRTFPPKCHGHFSRPYNCPTIIINITSLYTACHSKVLPSIPFLYDLDCLWRSNQSCPPRPSRGTSKKSQSPSRRTPSPERSPLRPHHRPFHPVHKLTPPSTRSPRCNRSCLPYPFRRRKLATVNEFQDWKGRCVDVGYRSQGSGETKIGSGVDTDGG